MNNSNLFTLALLPVFCPRERREKRKKEKEKRRKEQEKNVKKKDFEKQKHKKRFDKYLQDFLIKTTAWLVDPFQAKKAHMINVFYVQSCKFRPHISGLAKNLNLLCYRFGFVSDPN